MRPAGRPSWGVSARSLVPWGSETQRTKTNAKPKPPPRQTKPPPRGPQWAKTNTTREQTLRTNETTAARGARNQHRTRTGEKRTRNHRACQIMRRPLGEGRMAKGGSIWTHPKQPADRFPRLVYAGRYLNTNSLQRKFSNFGLGRGGFVCP